MIKLDQAGRIARRCFRGRWSRDRRRRWTITSLTMSSLSLICPHARLGRRPCNRKGRGAGQVGRPSLCRVVSAAARHLSTTSGPGSRDRPSGADRQRTSQRHRFHEGRAGAPAPGWPCAATGPHRWFSPRSWPPSCFVSLADGAPSASLVS